jgi:hypothetical protein
LTDDDDAVAIPKRHLMNLLFEKLAWLGSPKIYAIWFDEALNSALKAVCRNISQQTFEQSLLLCTPEL